MNNSNSFNPTGPNPFPTGPPYPPYPLYLSLIEYYNHVYTLRAARYYELAIVAETLEGRYALASELRAEANFCMDLVRNIFVKRDVIKDNTNRQTSD